MDIFSTTEMHWDILEDQITEEVGNNDANWYEGCFKSKVT